MKRVALFALACTFSGCLIYPKSVTHEAFVGIEEAAPVAVDKSIGWSITPGLGSDAADLVVRVADLKVCERARTEIYDETEAVTTDATTMGLDGAFGRGSNPLVSLVVIGVIAAAAAPIGVVSGIVSGIVVATHHDTTTRRRRALDSSFDTCATTSANVQVVLTLPSGAVLAAASDAVGRAHFAIPDGEAEAGRARVQIGTLERVVPFFRTPSACLRARDEELVRLAHTTDPAMRAQLARDLPVACNDARAAAWELLAVAALHAATSRCESIDKIGAQLRSLDPALYTGAFVSEPDIARCAGSPTHARAELSSGVGRIGDRS